jgi:hypothetical protein
LGTISHRHRIKYDSVNPGLGLRLSKFNGPLITIPTSLQSRTFYQQFFFFIFFFHTVISFSHGIARYRINKIEVLLSHLHSHLLILIPIFTTYPDFRARLTTHSVITPLIALSNLLYTINTYNQHTARAINTLVS